MLALRARQLAVYLCIWAHAIDATNYHLCTEEFHLSFFTIHFQLCIVLFADLVWSFSFGFLLEF